MFEKNNDCSTLMTTSVMSGRFRLQVRHRVLKCRKCSRSGSMRCSNNRYLSFREIGRQLNRHHSRISRKPQRNSTELFGYLNDGAQKRAQERRRNSRHQRRRSTARLVSVTWRNGFDGTVLQRWVSAVFRFVIPMIHLCESARRWFISGHFGMPGKEESCTSFCEDGTKSEGNNRSHCLCCRSTRSMATGDQWKYQRSTSSIPSKEVRLQQGFRRIACFFS